MLTILIFIQIFTYEHISYLMEKNNKAMHTIKNNLHYTVQWS